MFSKGLGILSYLLLPFLTDYSKKTAMIFQVISFSKKTSFRDFSQHKKLAKTCNYEIFDLDEFFSIFSCTSYNFWFMKKIFILLSRVCFVKIS